MATSEYAPWGAHVPKDAAVVAAGALSEAQLPPVVQHAAASRAARAQQAARLAAAVSRPPAVPADVDMPWRGTRAAAHLARLGTMVEDALYYTEPHVLAYHDLESSILLSAPPCLASMELPWPPVPPSVATQLHTRRAAAAAATTAVRVETPPPDAEPPMPHVTVRVSRWDKAASAKALTAAAVAARRTVLLREASQAWLTYVVPSKSRVRDACKRKDEDATGALGLHQLRVGARAHSVPVGRLVDESLSVSRRRRARLVSVFASLRGAEVAPPPPTTPTSGGSATAAVGAMMRNVHLDTPLTRSATRRASAATPPVSGVAAAAGAATADADHARTRAPKSPRPLSPPSTRSPRARYDAPAPPPASSFGALMPRIVALPPPPLSPLSTGSSGR